MKGSSNGDTVSGAATDDNDALTLLDHLAPNTWVGYGLNLIAIPCKGKGCENGFKPEWQATLEMLEFSKVSRVFDMGSKKGDAELRTARYLQTVINLADGRTVIHSEPGLWAHVLPPKQGAAGEEPPQNFIRLALTPHGDSILAEGKLVASNDGAPTISRVYPFPFSIEQGIPDIPTIDSDPASGLNLGENYVKPYSTSFPDEVKEKLKQLAPSATPEEIIQDPATFLRATMGAPTQIKRTYAINVSTDLPDPTLGVDRVIKRVPGLTSTPPSFWKAQTAGIINIPEITSGADAVLMDAIFWVEEMDSPSQDGSAQSPPPFQLQYVQRVILDFDVHNQRIHWPHISVATLKNVA